MLLNSHKPPKQGIPNVTACGPFVYCSFALSCFPLPFLFSVVVRRCLSAIGCVRSGSRPIPSVFLAAFKTRSVFGTGGSLPHSVLYSRLCSVGSRSSCLLPLLLFVWSFTGERGQVSRPWVYTPITQLTPLLLH